MGLERQNWLAPEDKQWLTDLSTDIWHHEGEIRHLKQHELEAIHECLAYSNNLFCRLWICPLNDLCLDIFQVPSPPKKSPTLLLRLTENHLPEEVDGWKINRKLAAEAIFSFYAGLPANKTLLEIYMSHKSR